MAFVFYLRNWHLNRLLVDPLLHAFLCDQPHHLLHCCRDFLRDPRHWDIHTLLCVSIFDALEPPDFNFLVRSTARSSRIFIATSDWAICCTSSDTLSSGDHFAATTDRRLNRCRNLPRLLHESSTARKAKAFRSPVDMFEAMKMPSKTPNNTSDTPAWSMCDSTWARDTVRRSGPCPTE